MKDCVQGTIGALISELATQPKGGIEGVFFADDVVLIFSNHKTKGL